MYLCVCVCVLLICIDGCFLLWPFVFAAAAAAVPVSLFLLLVLPAQALLAIYDGSVASFLLNKQQTRCGRKKGKTIRRCGERPPSSVSSLVWLAADRSTDARVRFHNFPPRKNGGRARYGFYVRFLRFCSKGVDACFVAPNQRQPDTSPSARVWVTEDDQRQPAEKG